MRKHQDGITIPELIIAIVLSGLVLALVMSFGFSYWSYGTAAEADQDSMVERLNVSDFLRDYLGSSSGLINQNGIPDANPESIDAATSPANYWTVIHAIPGTYNAPSSGAQPVVYFRRPSLNQSGAYIMNGTNPYEDEYMLFINGSKQLRVRTLANPNATGNKQLTTCGSAFVSTSCPADRLLIKNVASVTTRYFSKSGTVIDYTSSIDSGTGAYNGPDFPAVEVIELTIKLTYKPVFSKQTTSNSSVIRIALRNT